MTQPAKRTARVHSPAPGSAPPREGAIRFTIITSTYNASAQLGRTADSIRQQTHHNIQWIVVDGASTDDTSETVRACSDVVTTYISEPDHGIYDAWNKALPLIDGEWVLFLGAGDEFYSTSTLSELAECLRTATPTTNLVCGDVALLDANGKVKRIQRAVWAGVSGPWILGRPILPQQTGVAHRASLFQAGFRFDTRCRITADNELLLRELMAGCGSFIPLTISRFDYSGVSSNQRNRMRMILETVYVNWKVGLGLNRPFYQVGVLLANILRHGLLTMGLLRR